MLTPQLKRWKKYLAIVPLLLLGISTDRAVAQVVGKSLVYSIDQQPYEGYFARNEGFGDRQPLVLLIHDWDGLGTYEQRRAEMLAEQGYATFAIDLYGQGDRPKNVEESRRESGKLYNNRPLMLHRLLMSLERARQIPGIDNHRIVAIGYCFGGSAVLELARSGADVRGFVSFHGGLDTPSDENYHQVKAPILILHGTADPFAPLSKVAELSQSLTDAGVPFQVELYGGVKHAFTVWGAKMEGVQYDANADRRSWRSLLTFLQERLD